MKKKSLIVYILIVLIVLCTNVYGALTAKVELSPDKTTVKPGEDVIIAVNLNNISGKVSSVTGYIDVDEDVLSAFSKDTIVKNSDGKIEVISSGIVSNALSYAYAPTTLAEADADVVFNTNSSLTNNHDVYFVEDFNKLELDVDSVILKLKFTVNGNVQAGDLANAVKVTGLVAESTVMKNGTAVTEKSSELSSNLTIKVANSSADNKNTEENKNTNRNTNTNTNRNTNTNTNTNTNRNTNTNTNTNTNRNTNTNTNTNANINTNTNRNVNTNTNVNGNTNINKNTNTDNTLSGKSIPAAGAKTIIIPIVIVVVLGYVSYKKYIDYKGIE